MKKLILFLIMLPQVFAAGRGPAKDLGGITPDVRDYLVSIEKILINDVQYKSITTMELATSDYTSTDTWNFNIKLVDSANAVLRGITTSVTGFTVTTGGVAGGISDVSMLSGTVAFVGGSGKATVLSTGPWVKDTGIILTMPAITFGNMGGISSASATAVVTFNSD